MWQHLTDHERSLLIHHINNRGLDLRTQYTGMGCIEQSLMMAASCLSQVGVTVQEPVATIREQCDISRLCRRVITSFPPEHQGEHVSGTCSTA